MEFSKGKSISGAIKPSPRDTVIACRGALAWATVAVFLSLPAASAAQVAPAALRLPPVDEAPRDPELFALRARLLRAIGERDVETIVAAASEAVCLSFGGDAGKERLRELLEADVTGEYWGELAAALALGGVFVGDSAFYTPYLIERFPDDVDPFEGLLALGSDVPARRAPDPRAAVARTLSWEVVLRDREADRGQGWPEGWTAIRLSDGGTAWVATRSVRSPLDYRAYFRRRDGRWWLEAFVAGD